MAVAQRALQPRVPAPGASRRRPSRRIATRLLHYFRGSGADFEESPAPLHFLSAWNTRTTTRSSAWPRAPTTRRSRRPTGGSRASITPMSTRARPSASRRSTRPTRCSRMQRSAGATTRWARGRRHLDVKIPAGVDTGSRVRIAGEGARAGGGSGDLYLRVTVRPDPRFERKGDDLYVNLPVPVDDAALGAEVSVPTLKGQVSMKIPPETSSGRVFRLPRYGMPHLKGGGAGDQYVRVEIALPARLTSREKELFRELRTLRAETGG